MLEGSSRCTWRDEVVVMIVLRDKSFRLLLSCRLLRTQEASGTRSAPLPPLLAFQVPRLMRIAPLGLLPFGKGRRRLARKGKAEEQREVLGWKEEEEEEADGALKKVRRRRVSRRVREALMVVRAV